MQKIKIIDEYIGEILELFNTTLILFNDLKKETGDYREEVKEISTYLLNLWDLREKLYEQNPNMPQFELHQETIENQQRVDELLRMEDDILTQYHQNNFQVAYALSLQLLQQAEYGFFKRKAEAYLFCCLMQLNQSLGQSFNKRNIGIEELEELYQSALNAEYKHNFVLAEQLYEQLTRVSTFSQYELKGQAGMYRCWQKK
ncbi:MAG: hypothetical protein IJV35_10785 [Neisseriaceae bacterium]|nr:hypothetical protein [Neisseriaceae bacterium]